MRGVALALAIMAALGAAFSFLIGSGRDSDVARLRADLALDIERGGIVDLGQAQALSRRLVVADPDDREAADALAFVSAELAVDYGAGTAREAEAILARTPVRGGSRDAVSAMAAGARALGLVRAGNREAAARLAVVAAAAAPGTPQPLYALGRARAFAGDLPGAAHALEAAIVGTPGFSAARVAWAEVRLDLGDANAARAALAAVLAQAPRDLRAALLLDEAEQALDVADTDTLAGACRQGGSEGENPGKWPPAFIHAGCALAQAGRARRAGAREDALRRANAAAAVVPDEPRQLARIAEVLAQLGAVDKAIPLVDRARRLAAPEMPAIIWATVAIGLGHGRTASLPAGPRPADPETRLLVARAALAAGGLTELTRSLDALGDRWVTRDADLRLLARLRDDVETRGAVDSDDPLQAYVEGLRAQLDGDLPAAAERFWHALSGHGDACRAAGEYVATLRMLKLRPDPTAWSGLRAENIGCVNLR